jgi:long-chain acyl-CoA synthetase
MVLDALTEFGKLRVDDVSPRTTLGLFLRQAERFGNRTFVRFFDFKTERWIAMSWEDFRMNTLRVAAGLAAAGVKPQDRVVLLSENRVEWLFCDLGIQAAGAITVPVYANLTPASVQIIAEDSGASMAIVSNESQAAKLAAMPGFAKVVSMEDDVPGWLHGKADAAWSEVVARLADLKPSDVATIAYTSGTSGRPKGAVIPHGTIVAEIESCQLAYDIGPDDVILSILPFAHILERIAAFLFGTMGAGAELDLGRGPEHLLEDFQLLRPTCMDGVPRIFEKIQQKVGAEVQTRPPLLRAVFHWAVRSGVEYVRAARPGPLLRLRRALADRLVLSGMRHRVTGGRLRFFLCGSAPLRPDVEEFFWAIGLPIYQGWGMTELTCAATVNTITEHRLGSVGKPLPGVAIRLAADGEIEVTSPGAMREYHRNPEATAETITDGWVRTGDIGHIDHDGFLSITDRKKDLIKTSGGKFVAPQPIEGKLQQDPHIETAIVVGDGRQFVTALIVPDWDAVTSELALTGPTERLVGEPRLTAMIQKRVDEVNAGLARFETVKYFRLLPRSLSLEADELTPTLKVKRRVVQDRYRDLIDEMYGRTTQVRSA